MPANTQSNTVQKLVDSYVERAELMNDMLRKVVEQNPATSSSVIVARLSPGQRMLLDSLGYTSDRDKRILVSRAENARRLMRDAGGPEEYAAAKEAAAAAAKRYAKESPAIRKKVEELESQLRALQDDVDSTGREVHAKAQARESLRSDKVLPPDVVDAIRGDRRRFEQDARHKRRIELRYEIRSLERVASAASWEDVKYHIQGKRPRIWRGGKVDLTAFAAYQAELKQDTLPPLREELEQLDAWYAEQIAIVDKRREYYIDKL